MYLGPCGKHGRGSLEGSQTGAWTGGPPFGPGKSITNRDMREKKSRAIVPPARGWYTVQGNKTGSSSVNNTDAQKTGGLLHLDSTGKLSKSKKQRFIPTRSKNRRAIPWNGSGGTGTASR